MKLKKKITIIAIATVMAAGSIGAIGANAFDKRVKLTTSHDSITKSGGSNTMFMYYDYKSKYPIVSSYIYNRNGDANRYSFYCDYTFDGITKRKNRGRTTDKNWENIVKKKNNLDADSSKYLWDAYIKGACYISDELITPRLDASMTFYK